jgi:hypothetical protein
VKIETVIGDRAAEILEECEAHLAYQGNNYYPFLWKFYQSHRATLFQIIRSIKLKSTTQDRSLEDAIQFLIAHQNSRQDWLDIFPLSGDESPTENPIISLNLEWIPPKWWWVITHERNRSTCPSRLCRKHFEVCVFSQIMWELKSGDLYIEGSEAYADYRQQQISWSEYERTVEDYGQLVGLPIEGKAFVTQVKSWLSALANQTDRSFPHNQYVRLEKDRFIIKKTKKAVNNKQLILIESLLKQRLKPVNLLDILTDTELWLNWTRFFHPLSGHEAKIAVLKKALQNPTERGTALRLLECLSIEERQRLFDDLLDLASVSHSDIELCRQAILSFPKNWLLANIEASAEPLLQNGTYEEYRRLLELYIQIDETLTKRLANRAIQHEYLDISEAGEDFQKYLKNQNKTLVAGR